MRQILDISPERWAEFRKQVLHNYWGEDAHGVGVLLCQREVLDGKESYYVKGWQILDATGEVVYSTIDQTQFGSRLDRVRVYMQRWGQVITFPSPSAEFSSVNTEVTPTS